MLYSEFLNEFNKNKKIKFRLYCLEYIIEEKNGLYEIKTLSYPEKKIHQFKTLAELFDSYTIYNEILRRHLNKMNLIQ